MQALAGWVLAGGYSRRLGADKALLKIDGEPLAARTARIVRDAVGSVALVGRADRLAELGLPAIDDFESGQGPLAGILTALRSSAAEWNLICACDFPYLDGEFLRVLCNAQPLCSVREFDAVVPRMPDGKIQPLCALYRCSCLEPFESAYAQGTRAVWRALSAVCVHWLDVSSGEWAFNLNTPKDLSALHYGG